MFKKLKNDPEWIEFKEIVTNFLWLAVFLFIAALGMGIIPF